MGFFFFDAVIDSAIACSIEACSDGCSMYIFLARDRKNRCGLLISFSPATSLSFS